MEGLRRTFGIAEPVRRGMELKIAREGEWRASVLGGSSGVHGDVLEGRDWGCEWEDVFKGTSFRPDGVPVFGTYCLGVGGGGGAEEGGDANVARRMKDAEPGGVCVICVYRSQGATANMTCTFRRRDERRSRFPYGDGGEVEDGLVESGKECQK